MAGKQGRTIVLLTLIAAATAGSAELLRTPGQTGPRFEAVKADDRLDPDLPIATARYREPSTDADTPAVLRGPMVTRYTQQFLRQVEWGDLDYLILDLPPGTGDIQLTVVQTVALAGAIVVTTPQEVALIDARKAVAMFHKTNVRVLGIVENMSHFVCPGDGLRYDIFGSGGGQREADRLGVPLLGEVPIDIATREAGDTGMPIVARAQESAVGREFMKIARALRAELEGASEDHVRV